MYEDQCAESLNERNETVAMTIERAEQIAKEWLDAWNSHDLDRIMRHYSPDVEFISPFVQRLMDNDKGVVHGTNALREYFARGLAAYPDLHFELLNVVGGVQSIVMIYRSVKNTLAVEMMELNSEDRVTRVVAHYGMEP